MADNSKEIELTLLIVDKLINLAAYESKDEVMAVGNNALNLILDDDTVPEEIKNGYKSAVKKISSMTWEEIKNNRSK